MDEPSERIARLIGLIDEAGLVVKCPVCTENEWDYGAATLAIPQGAPNPRRAGLHTFPLICRRCGYVRLHSVTHLEKSSEDH